MDRNLRHEGTIYEDAVIKGLQERGFDLIVRNYNVHRRGELDAVFERAGHVYIVEVKARRRSTAMPDALDAITPEKIRRMKRCVPYLVSEYRLYGKNIHFLAGCVTVNDDGSIQNVQIVPFE